VAPLDRFNPPARKLLEPFDQWRLVITKHATQGGGSTVEAANEAIFRGWARFQRWLEPERARLEALRGLETAAHVWDRQGRRRAYLDHRGQRLKAARALMGHADFQKEIGPTQRAYLAAAKRAQGRRYTAAGAGIVALAAASVGLWWAANWMIGNETTPRVALGVLAVKAGLVGFIEPDMVELEGGTFSMGSTEGEATERPPHPVQVPPFAIGRYEVTFDDYDVFVFDTGASRPPDGDYGRGQRPVIFVNWPGAKAYVEWLRKITGKPYRLPSEAEWEYAARAGTTTRYWWGDDDPTPDKANMSGADAFNGPAAVGSYPANPRGLYDMNGNVWEWVDDCWNESYEGEARPDDGSAWLGGDCSMRVLRGGSWSGSEPMDLRSANRRGDNNEFFDIGFRVARTLSRSESVTP
jgi:formylglycine-generating enzyme required for sulfatase activity